MRGLLFIFLAMAIVWPLTYFGLPAAGYPLKSWAIILFPTLSALYAGALVLVGESIIEDAVKSGLLLILTGLGWFVDSRAGFLFLCALAASVVGTLLNQASRATSQR